MVMAHRNMETSAPVFSLSELRAEIDRIDGAMHELLMQRGDIIDRLIKVKRTAEFGLGFSARPRGRHDATPGGAPSRDPAA